MKTNKPQLIAVVGGSGAGKTWLADQLQTALGKNATRLSLDDFYRDRSHLSAKRRSAINFDHPRAIDWEHVEQVLSKFAAGRGVRKPHYDFVTHARAGNGEFMKPKPLIIVDGLWLLRRPAIRKLFTYRIFVDCPRDVCLTRRMERDRLERGRKTANIKKQFFKQVLPMHDRFVGPQLRWANTVVTNPSAKEITGLAQKIKNLLQTN
ncbi:MAG: uridine kinase [Verrucomicrobiota bacterium]